MLGRVTYVWDSRQAALAPEPRANGFAQAENKHSKAPDSWRAKPYTLS
jgi:hypothetical protein